MTHIQRELQTVRGHPGRAHRRDYVCPQRSSISKSTVFSAPFLESLSGFWLLPTPFTYAPLFRGPWNRHMPRNMGLPEHSCPHWTNHGRVSWGTFGQKVRLWLGQESGEDPPSQPRAMVPPPSSLPLLPLNLFLEPGKLCEDGHVFPSPFYPADFFPSAKGSCRHCML